MKITVTAMVGITASVIALGVLGAVAGPIVYSDAMNTPSAAEARIMPTVRQDAPEIVVDTPAGLSGEWTVTAGSSAGYRLDEILNGSEVTVTGSTEHVTGQATLSGLSLTAAEFSVDVASITSDNITRDSFFRIQALQASEFPEATFTMTGPAVSTSEPQRGVPQTLTARGELSLRGVTREVTVELNAVLGKSSVLVTGSVPIRFSDFGVEPPKLGFVTVEDTGFVDFTLNLIPS
jgi:polyisoprenoid-binding protein YceI